MSGATEASISKATILVVDSEVLVRFAISDYLRDCGYRVIEAASCEEALLVIAKTELAISVVLCDAAFDGHVSAFNLSQSIRSQNPGIAVILAGTPAQATHAAAELCDEGPKLARPYEPQLVADRIKRLIAKRSREDNCS